MAAQEKARRQECACKLEEATGSLADSFQLSVQSELLKGTESSIDQDKSTINSPSIQSSIISCTSSEDGLAGINEFDHIINTIGEGGLISSNNVITCSSNTCEVMDSLSGASFKDSGRSSLCLDPSAQGSEFTDCTSLYLEAGMNKSVTNNDTNLNSNINNIVSEDCMHNNGGDNGHSQTSSFEDYRIKTKDQQQIPYSGIEGQTDEMIVNLSKCLDKSVILSHSPNGLLDFSPE